MNDEVTAGTLDMFGVFDSSARGGPHGHGIDLDSEYLLGETERVFAVPSMVIPTADLSFTVSATVLLDLPARSSVL
jgi:hypothetical protein